VSVLLSLLACIVGFVVAVWIYNAVLVRVRARSRRRFLREAPVGELARECARSVRFMGWAKRSAGAPLVDPNRHWTERGLLDALEALLEEVTADGKHGYGSNEYFFYDGGFAATSEALRKRLGIPQPWDVKRHD
jgi:hypothetical protein